MCTAVSLVDQDHYFGRTMDYDRLLPSTVTFTPRKFPLPFRYGETLQEHYAIMGMGHVMEGYPLYYEAFNEKGLCMAGLNFMGNACYGEVLKGKENIPQFELIPWILGRCKGVGEVRELLKNLNIPNTPFRDGLPAAPLHWIIADKKDCIVLECVAEGLKLYDDPAGVLANNPPFPMHLFMLQHHMGLATANPQNRFAASLNLEPHSQGMGALGLPGDYSSPSRFVRAAFARMNSAPADTEEERVSQFFHVMSTVEQPRGSNILPDGAYEISLYTCCCNASKGIYYYRSYEDINITAVDMHKEDLNAAELRAYPMSTHLQFIQGN